MLVDIILGLPSSGKSKLADKIVTDSQIIVKTDLFNNDAKKLLNMIVINHNIYKKDLLIEGVLCYELLLLKDIEKYINKVYYIQTDLKQVEENYNTFRKDKNIVSVINFCKSLNNKFEKIDKLKFNIIYK